MKKTLLSLIMLTSIGIYSSQAQITVNFSDVVGPGDVVEQAKDTLPSVNIGGGGGSQIWNFPSLAQHELDTLFFKNPSPMPGFSNFPLANMGLEDSSEDSTWIFLTKNGTGLYVDGSYQIEDGQANIWPIVSTIITFPSTMGTNYGGSWNGTLVVFPIGLDPDGIGPLPFIDSVKVTRDASLTSNIDGWGTVTTPFATGGFPAIRQIVIEEAIDTTWIAINGSGVWNMLDGLTAGLFGLDTIAYDTTRTARWWTDDPSSKFPIVEMDYEANGTVNSVAWQKSSPTVGVAEQASSINEVSLYPSPAATEITIETSLSKNNSIKIMDATGKLISDYRFNTNKITLSVSEFDNGVYFYNIYDVDGNILHSNKFVIAK